MDFFMLRKELKAWHVSLSIVEIKILILKLIKLELKL